MQSMSSSLRVAPACLVCLAVAGFAGGCSSSAASAEASSDAGLPGQPDTGAPFDAALEATLPEAAEASVADAPIAPSRGPTPANGTSNFPFPQNRQAAGCTYPAAYENSDVQAAYAKWKADLVTSDNADGHERVQRTSTDGVDACRPLNSTVSEGIGYGMLIAVYMDDETLFDSFWLYEQKNLDDNQLMNWAPDGSGAGCTGAATDADEDMAFALIMADRQWGGAGSIGKTYRQAAIDQVHAIWVNEIYGYSWPRAGDGAWASNANQNISYYAPAYYRAFAAIDPQTCAEGSSVAYAQANGCDRWWGVIDQSYSTIADALSPASDNQSNGLVPGWCNDSNGAPCTAATGEPFTYQYDACRTPFRIGLDACLNGEPRAKAYVALTSSFFGPIGATNIADGYALDGAPQPANPGQLAAAFIGPATVGAMSSASYQAFINAGYASVATGTDFAGGEYYASSWTVMALLMLTGNFLDYTQVTPVQ
jgi:endo-1,4-beta-D-glucanase Y